VRTRSARAASFPSAQILEVSRRFGKDDYIPGGGEPMPGVPCLDFETWEAGDPCCNKLRVVTIRSEDENDLVESGFVQWLSKRGPLRSQVSKARPGAPDLRGGLKCGLGLFPDP
jgi:hypothetical protein